MHFLKRGLSAFFGETKSLRTLNILHIFNDGSKVALIILLPFLAKELHINLTQVGFLGTLLNVCLILFAIPAGYFSAKIGGFKVLLLGLLCYGIGFIFTGFAFSYAMLVMTYLIAGMGYGVFHPVGMLLITKWSDKQTRGREMGNFTALGDIGTVILPGILASLVVFTSWRLVVVCFGIVFLLILFVCSFFLKIEKPLQQKKEVQKISLLFFLRHPQFLLATASGALDNFASQSFIIFIPFLLLKKGMSPSLIGIFATIFFIGSFAGKTLLGRSLDTFGNVKVFVFSEICMACFIILLTYGTFVPLLFIAAIIVGIFTKGTAPVTATMISDVVDHSGNAEKAFGLNGVTSGIAITISPVFLGFIADRYGISQAFIWMAVFAIVATIPALFLRKTQAKVLLNEKLLTED